MKTFYCSMILACGSKGELGANQGLLWDLPKDMARFVKLTKGSNVLMGRNTYFSLPRHLPALPGRTNIVITSMPDKVFQEYERRSLHWKGAPIKLLCASSIEEALELSHDKITNPNRYNSENFIIGGAALYDYALEHGGVDIIYRTMVHGIFENADTCVRYLDYGSMGFKPQEIEHVPSDDSNGYFMTFEKWKRDE